MLEEWPVGSHAADLGGGFALLWGASISFVFSKTNFPLRLEKCRHPEVLEGSLAARLAPSGGSLSMGHGGGLSGPCLGGSEGDLVGNWGSSAQAGLDCLGTTLWGLWEIPWLHVHPIKEEASPPWLPSGLCPVTLEVVWG